MVWAGVCGRVKRDKSGQLLKPGQQIRDFIVFGIGKGVRPEASEQPSNITELEIFAMPTPHLPYSMHLLIIPFLNHIITFLLRIIMALRSQMP